MTYRVLAVSEEALLPGVYVYGFKGPFACLNRARYGIAWGTVGAKAGMTCADPWARADRPAGVLLSYRSRRR